MWKWVLLGAAVLWYMNEREKASVAKAGNRAVTNTIDHTGQAVNRIIDEAGPAIGSWLSRLLGGGAASSPTPSAANTATPSDYYDWSADGDYV